MPSFIPLKHLAGYLNASRKKLIYEPSIFPSKKNRLSKKVSQPLTDVPPLTDDLWSQIVSYCGPFDLLRMRRVNRQLSRIVDAKLDQILYLDVIMCNIDDILSVDADDDGEFYRHPKCEILLHISDRSAILVVDEKWSSKDVSSLWAALQMFRDIPHNVMIDAQIAEMIMAAAAGVKLSRWHTFEAYTKVCSLQDVPSLHMKCSKSVVPSTKAKWPVFSNCKELTIRCSTLDIPYVARLGDYGAGPEALFPKSVELVRLSVVETKSRSRESKFAKSNRPNRQLAVFRRWVRANDLLEKYCQQYS